ncbi:MAG: xylose isomerase [Spirochaetales bacterium]|uniref:Xylose isomerase n=1 Tax=Candidatus Thalassospirochaeta sargassi TaxID=3119039 RepID=A0AAJ1ICR7_9SPIO|nr:xylose isomerase [Spirochaetales bacterium]
MANDFFTGNKEFFPGIGKIKYEGPQSDNPLAFKFYDSNKMIGGKSMRDHLRFAIAYWHSFCGDGADPFGGTTHFYPWNKAADPMEAAKDKLDAAFEFFTKIDASYWCFHDKDIAPEGGSLADFEKNVQTITALAKERQNATGMKLLWGTANLFSHERYMNGAFTNPNFEVVTYAAAQVKAAIDATVELGGDGYVFWGGREGYMSLLNTNMKREKDHLARALEMARDYGRKAGFKGQYMIEPKPMEPTKHQYDFDTETVVSFIKNNGFEDDFRVNIENNHATLAGHTFWHDLQVAVDAGLLGSIDANQGDYQNGWDTDQFPTNVFEATRAMMVVLDNGGLGKGGLNFDAKRRRNSTDAEDLFIAHIGGMDTFALGLEAAYKVKNESSIPTMLRDRYSSFDTGAGADFEAGKFSLEDLQKAAFNTAEPETLSGKQELYENIVNSMIYGK